MNASFRYQGQGDKNITVEGPLSSGKWELSVWSKNGNVVGAVSLPNGLAVERRFNVPTSGGASSATRPFQLDQACPHADLKVTANPNTSWNVTLSLVSEAIPAGANTRVEERESMQSPEYVCVNIVDSNNSRLNVRTGPGYTSFSKVEGGDRDREGGVMPGVRYKVVETERNGELVSGNPIWHKIEFTDRVLGWVSEFYVDSC